MAQTAPVKKKKPAPEAEDDNDKGITIKLRTRNPTEKTRIMRAANRARNSINGWALDVLLKAALESEGRVVVDRAVLGLTAPSGNA